MYAAQHAGKSDAGPLHTTKVDMSQQEMSRCVTHVEDIWQGYTQDTIGKHIDGCDWLPTDHVSSMMCQELGYEDEAELEDALQCSLVDFLCKLPHIVTKIDEGRWVTYNSPSHWMLH